jgi:hypothetical protein
MVIMHEHVLRAVSTCRQTSLLTSKRDRRNQLSSSGDVRHGRTDKHDLSIMHLFHAVRAKNAVYYIQPLAWLALQWIR